MRWSIRNQIMLPLLAVAILSLTAVGIVNAILTEQRTRDHVERQLQQVINVLSTSSFPLTSTVLRQMHDLSSADFVLIDEHGSVVATTLRDAVTPPERVAVSRIQDVQLGHSSQLDGKWYFHTLVRLPLGAQGARSGVLHVLFPQDEYRRAWRQSFVPSFVVGAITSLVLAGVGWLIARRMSIAIHGLKGEVLRIAQGDFQEAPLPAIDDELRDLSAAVNRTAAMLAEFEQQVRRSEQMRTLSIVGASIAHQLRNAVTGCRMALDLHATECRTADDEECLVVAKRQLKLMESQLQRFLRIGKRPEVLTRRDIDLGTLVEDLLPLVRPAAQHAGVALECQIPSAQLVINGDEEALSQVLINLLLNAIEAAQQQGLKEQERASFVRVEIAADNADDVHIVISDSGGGPGEAVAATLFEPFVTSKAEGAGLGLTVANEVIAAHGGTIDWRRKDEMTQFRVALPLAKFHPPVVAYGATVN